MEGGRSFAGKAFVDATYEGDLMALAGVSFIVGRGPNSSVRRGHEWHSAHGTDPRGRPVRRAG